jgi:hypothetical protein
LPVGGGGEPPSEPNVPTPPELASLVAASGIFRDLHARRDDDVLRVERAGVRTEEGLRQGDGRVRRDDDSREIRQEEHRKEARVAEDELVRQAATAHAAQIQDLRLHVDVDLTARAVDVDGGGRVDVERVEGVRAVTQRERPTRAHVAIVVRTR